MRIKIIDSLSYQTYPITDNMIEIPDGILQEIGKTLQFSGTSGATIPYTPPKFELGYEELVEQKIRQKYTVSQEFAILRQRDTKPQEYQAYFEFCEQCKAQAKQEKI